MTYSSGTGGVLSGLSSPSNSGCGVSSTFGGSAGDRVKPFLISRAVPVSFSYGELALFVLPLGATG